MPERIDKSVWKAAETAVIEGNVGRLEDLLRKHPEVLQEMFARYGPQTPGVDLSGLARSIIAGKHCFRNFDEFSSHQEALNDPAHPVAQFEAAVDAIVDGHIPNLERLLAARPDLIQARSLRTHRSTLLHYIGANGVESWRQKTPLNAVEVAEVLLEAGVDINSVADMYGGGATTLGLVATSIHPWRAGVLERLLETLLRNGASMGGPELVNGCLANGRPRAAIFLALRGAPLDLEGAAGVGRLDLVETYFEPDGRLRNATEDQMLSGFAWACEYGWTEVVELLLDKGVPIDAKIRNHGQTGLHWAAHGAHVNLVRFLLDRGAPVNCKDPSFDLTPLGWALHGWSEGVPETPKERYYDVVSVLVRSGGTVDRDWLAGSVAEKLQGDPRMLEALGKN